MGTPDGRCIACKGDLQSIGTERFRVGGTTGGWKLLFGEWAELGEDMLSFEVLACTACRPPAPRSINYGRPDGPRAGVAKLGQRRRT